MQGELTPRKHRRAIAWVSGAAYCMLALSCSGSGADQTSTLRSTASDNPANHACALKDCDVIGRRAPAELGPVCPASKPEASLPCETNSLECSYGSSLATYCREFFECVGRIWTVAESSCVSQPEGFCPATPQPGQACTVGRISVFVPCEYPEAVACYCLGNPKGRLGAAGRWECWGPPPNGNCPEVLPNLGDGCSTTGQYCEYGVVGQGCDAPYATVYCRQGAWESAGEVCVD
jgi:hypothetical protein